MFSCIPENAIKIIFQCLYIYIYIFFKSHISQHPSNASTATQTTIATQKSKYGIRKKKKKIPRIQTTTFNTYLNLQRGMPRLQTTINFMPPLSLQATN